MTSADLLQSEPKPEGTTWHHGLQPGVIHLVDDETGEELMFFSSTFSDKEGHAISFWKEEGKPDVQLYFISVQQAADWAGNRLSRKVICHV